MASLVLLLSFLVRNKNQEHSIVSSTSFCTIKDDSCLNARWTQQREWSNYESELEKNLEENILQESKVCIYLV
ncbi:hypothetical protein MtrunA17_Chr6g0460321 [Medicago truncatula]|jgi:hypothetical protein|uniref:Uncharacterized protein n=1 Tax=Medicago truncatula TaxID=3880 RepID=G7KP66_MEDTR|nr:hypothetical protein MTR_6g026820 [Medicago truncatula]RHN50696.1 hypothetical protein MtrunA17_Chr6g0460321 [Medicago truncatula]